MFSDKSGSLGQCGVDLADGRGNRKHDMRAVLTPLPPGVKPMRGLAMRLACALPALLALSACVSGPPRSYPAPQPLPSARPTAAPRPVPPEEAMPPQAGTGFMAPEILRERGLDGVIRETGANLLRRFGTPRLEVFEGDMRKLQFEGPACVLDIFLYPLAPGSEPVATWVEARRRSDGAPVDRAACIAALSAR